MSGFWKVIAGPGNCYIEDFKEKKCIAVGWGEMGDLTQVTTPVELEKLFYKVYPDATPTWRGAQLGGIRKFRFDMQVGDKVISYDSSAREYLYGTITSDYRYENGKIGTYPSIRDVTWEDRRVSRDELSQSTRNGLTVLTTIVQPGKDVRTELEGILAGRKPKKPDEEDIAEVESAFQSQLEKSRELIKDRLSKIDWSSMQELVAAILRSMGFKTRVSPAGPDKGKDIVASPDGLGLQVPRIKVEVKHRKETVSAVDVRSFLGGLHKDDKGLYVSTGGFTHDAEYEAERAPTPVTLINLDTLTTLLTQHYDSLDAVGKSILPLTRLFWPTE